MSNLDNKVAVVTGASKGIGAAIAKHLAAAGATVVVGYSSSKEGAEKTVADIAARGGKAIAVKASVPDEAEIAALFDTVKKKYGKIDILVNNAGVYEFSPLELECKYPGALQPAVHMQRARRAADHESGLAAVPAERRQRGQYKFCGQHAGAGNGLGVSDSRERSIPSPAPSPRSWRPCNIFCVNAVNPGLVKTEGSAGFANGDFEKEAVAATPLGRVGEPDDITGGVPGLGGSAGSPAKR